MYKHLSSWWAVIVIFLTLNSVCLAGPDNIAPEATVLVSSEFNDQYQGRLVNDGIIGVHMKGEWANKGWKAYWGMIKYPWVRLEWPTERTINRVVIYDRANLDDHFAGGTLEFSDGSKVLVHAIPNDGSPKEVLFPPKRIKWLRLESTDADGLNIGLSEIEVFAARQDTKDFVSWVEPTIESARGRWFFFATGSRPFGMISAAPHTRNKNQYGGGYNYNSMEVLGFSQIHAWMLSGVELMPTTGPVDPTQGEPGWKSPFKHESEIIQPGYHRLFLDRYRTWVELTATDRVSFYRLSYTEDAEANVLVNLGGYLGASTMKNASVQKTSNTTIEGSFDSVGRLWGGPKTIRIHFAAQFDQPFQTLDGWKGNQRLENIGAVEGDDAGVAVRYHVQAGDQLQVKISISYTSIENARQNLASECSHWDFDQVRNDSRNVWNQWLGKIQVEGGTYAQKVKFYTDLWHVLLGRHKLNDVSGDYPDYTQGKRTGNHTEAKFIQRTLPKNEAGQVKFNMYNSDAFWLTMWNLNTLWGLAWPHLLDDFSASLMQYDANGGLLPRGPCAGGYSYIMTGCPATSLIVSAYMKGLLNKVDAQHAFDTIKRNHLPGGMQGGTGELEFYIKNGWCPNNAGTTVQWAFEDWAAAQMAGKLNRAEDQREFLRRSAGWTNCFDSVSGFIFPKKADGTWLHKDPLKGQGWVEANAWQGTWSVSHDIPRLVELMGGRDAFCAKLEHAFRESEELDYVFGYGGGYVSYANQPGCSNAHVFNHARKPWLSQYWVRKVNEQAYGAITPDQGYGGHDEDQGQMGGISALMSLGLFSLRGGCDADPIYEITSPVFDRITYHLDSDYYTGQSFVIETRNNSAENCYIQSAELNGQSLDQARLYHRDFARGGELILTLGPEPNMD